MIVDKPWGKVVTYALNQPSSVRVITVDPGQETSVHFHRMRDEMWVVLDEGQFITDPNRGITVELHLTLLIRAREQGVTPQLLVLSAVIGNINAFDQWLGCEKLVISLRPVPLPRSPPLPFSRSIVLPTTSGAPRRVGSSK